MTDSIRRYTDAELLNAKALRETLVEYVDCGHVVDINGNVFVNRVGEKVFGRGVWTEMLKEINK